VRFAQEAMAHACGVLFQALVEGHGLCKESAREIKFHKFVMRVLTRIGTASSAPLVAALSNTLSTASATSQAPGHPGKTG
jgi:hypothetical protein